jgi:hypothetical protein
MFYSASTALLQLLAHAEDPASPSPGSPPAWVDRWLRPKSRKIDRSTSAAARERTPLQTLSPWQQEPEPGC